MQYHFPESFYILVENRAAEYFSKNPRMKEMENWKEGQLPSNEQTWRAINDFFIQKKIPTYIRKLKPGNISRTTFERIFSIKPTEGVSKWEYLDVIYMFLSDNIETSLFSHENIEKSSELRKYILPKSLDDFLGIENLIDLYKDKRNLPPKLKEKIQSIKIDHFHGYEIEYIDKDGNKKKDILYGKNFVIKRHKNSLLLFFLKYFKIITSIFFCIGITAGGVLYFSKEEVRNEPELNLKKEIQLFSIRDSFQFVSEKMGSIFTSDCERFGKYGRVRLMQMDTFLLSSEPINSREMFTFELIENNKIEWLFPHLMNLQVVSENIYLYPIYYKELISIFQEMDLTKIVTAFPPIIENADTFKFVKDKLIVGYATKRSIIEKYTRKSLYWSTEDLYTYDENPKDTVHVISTRLKGKMLYKRTDIFNRKKIQINLSNIRICSGLYVALLPMPILYSDEERYVPLVIAVD